MIAAAIPHLSKAALWVASIGALMVLVLVVCGRGNAPWMPMALAGLLACRGAAELGHGWVWRRHQPPGRRR